MVAFGIDYNFPISFLSFSQRRFLGFREQFEFDKKRVVASSRKEFAVLGYDAEEKVYELLRSFVPPGESIRYIGFLEDQLPNFLLLITYGDQGSQFKIMKLKKNPNFQEEFNEEAQGHLQERIIDQMKEGKLREKRRRSMDNIEVVPVGKVRFTKPKIDLEHSF